MAASYFDVDGTLVTTNLVHPTLFYMLNQRTPLHSLAKLGRALVTAPSGAPDARPRPLRAPVQARLPPVGLRF